MRSRALVTVAALVAALAASPALAVSPAFAASLAPASPGAAKLPLGHAGRWITDASGRVVILHGINMVYKRPPYYPAAIGFGNDDAAFLSSIGFNAVRVGVIWKAVEPRPGVFDNGYLNKIAGTVRTLARHGIVSLLDFHQDMYNELFQGEGAPDWAVQDDGLPITPKEGFPANYLVMPALWRAFDNFWNNSPGPGGVGLEDRYAAAWRHVAQIFRRRHSVLGYELFNEPWPGTGWGTCVTPLGCPAFDSKLTAFDRLVRHAIRAADPRTLIFYEPNVLFDSGAVTHVGGLQDADAGFAFHDYCLTASPSGCSSEVPPFTNALAHVAATHEAVIMTEFGATNAVGDLTGMVAKADHYMVPWLEWAYCGCSDPTTTGPGTSQAIVINPAKPPRGSNLEHSTLGALVEPYPNVVAGTPQSWSYDRSARTFKLRYVRARAGGRGQFGTGSVTTIATPRLVYAGHYAVVVSGGAILSRRGASTLRIGACPRAGAITVTVKPSGRSRSSCRLTGR